MPVDPSFAQPAHKLGTTGPLPGPDVTPAPAGGQAFALDPDGTIPSSLLTSSGSTFAIESGLGVNGSASTGATYIDSLPGSQSGSAGEVQPVLDYDLLVAAGGVLQIAGRFTAADQSGTGRGTIRLAVETTTDLRGVAWTAYESSLYDTAITSNGQVTDVEFDWTDVTATNFPGLVPAKWLRVVLRAKHTVANVRATNAYVVGRWA